MPTEGIVPSKLLVGNTGQFNNSKEHVPVGEGAPQGCLSE